MPKTVEVSSDDEAASAPEPADVKAYSPLIKQERLVELQLVPLQRRLLPDFGPSLAGKDNVRPQLSVEVGPQRGNTGEVDMSQTVHALLTPELEGVLGQFIDILMSEARNQNMLVTSTNVDDVFDPELGRPIIVVTQYVAAIARAALDYRDSVSSALASWRSTLPKEHKEVASRQLVFEVRWS